MLRNHREVKVFFTDQCFQCKQEALIANSAELNLDSPCYFKTLI